MGLRSSFDETGAGDVVGRVLRLATIELRVLFGRQSDERPCRVYDDEGRHS